MQNIHSFLAALPSLGVTDLFEADELYYASDFSRVVNTLSKLSKSIIAGIKGFKYAFFSVVCINIIHILCMRMYLSLFVNMYFVSLCEICLYTHFFILTTIFKHNNKTNSII